PNAYTSRAAPGSEGPALAAGTPAASVATTSVETPSRPTKIRATTDRIPKRWGHGARGFVGSFGMGTSTAALPPAGPTNRSGHLEPPAYQPGPASLPGGTKRAKCPYLP